VLIIKSIVVHEESEVFPSKAITFLLAATFFSNYLSLFGNLKSNRNLLSTILEAGKSKIKVPEIYFWVRAYFSYTVPSICPFMAQRANKLSWGPLQEPNVIT
jgi:hypothetical protein